MTYVVVALVAFTGGAYLSHAYWSHIYGELKAEFERVHAKFKAAEGKIVDTVKNVRSKV